MDASVLGLWLFPATASLQPITITEEQWAKSLGQRRAKQFRHSRGYARKVLSELFKVPALNIPLIASPGSAPKLSKGWGYISWSNCEDALLVGWSKEQIGVDLEKRNRSLSADRLAKRFFFPSEINDLQGLDKERMRKEVLDLWIIKEAAIKWQKGSIALNLRQWEWQKNNSIAINKSLQKKVKIKKINYHYWEIAIASNTISCNQSTLLCLDNLLTDRIKKNAIS